MGLVRLTGEVKRLVDLLVSATDKEDLITIHGAIRLKLEMIREILDAIQQQK